MLSLDFIVHEGVQDRWPCRWLELWARRSLNLGIPWRLMKGHVRKKLKGTHYLLNGNIFNGRIKWMHFMKHTCCDRCCWMWIRRTGGRWRWSEVGSRGSTCVLIKEGLFINVGWATAVHTKRPNLDSNQIHRITILKSNLPSFIPKGSMERLDSIIFMIDRQACFAFAATFLSFIRVSTKKVFSILIWLIWVKSDLTFFPIHLFYTNLFYTMIASWIGWAFMAIPLCCRMRAFWIMRIAEYSAANFCTLTEPDCDSG